MNKYAKIILLGISSLAVLILIAYLFIPPESDPRYEAALKEGTINALERYIKNTESDRFKETAEEKLEELYFERLKAKGTVRRFIEFKEKFPESVYQSEFDKMFRDAFLKQAEEMPSLFMYTKFLEFYPDAPQKEKIKVKISNLIQQRVEPLREIKRIGIVVDMKMPSMASLPLSGEILKLVEYAGLQPVLDKTENEPFKLVITGSGEPLSMEYEKRGLQYTGATLEGRFKFTLENQVLKEGYFLGTENCMRSLGKDDYSQPSSAPFDYAYLNSDFPLIMLQAFEKLFGENIVTATLTENGTYSQNAAGEILLNSVAEGDEESAELLGRTLKYADDNFSIWALNQLATMKSSLIYIPLMRALENNDSLIVKTAIMIIRSNDVRGTIPYLRERLNSDYFEVRSQAALALGEFQDAQSIDSIIALLNDKKAYPRQAAVQALGKFENKKAYLAIAEALDDKNIEIRKTALDILKVATGNDFQFDIAAWKEFLEKM